MPASLRLKPAQLHVIRMQAGPGSPFAGRSDLLDAAEMARARRFRFEADRARFICMHAQMRQALGAMLEADPGSLVFETSEHGKPSISGSAVRFNLSHSRDLGLLGVILEQEVGVDVEAVRAEVDIEAIAGRFFAPLETQELMALPAERRVEGFFNGWTRKEAYMKARGLGMKISLQGFAVSLAPGAPARLIHPEPGAPAEWSVIDLDPGPGFRGAAVVQGAAPAVFCWDFQA